MYTSYSIQVYKKLFFVSTKYSIYYTVSTYLLKNKLCIQPTNFVFNIIINILIFNSSIMKDDPDFNIKFVEFIENHKCIYDYNTKEYSCRVAQDKA